MRRFIELKRFTAAIVSVVMIAMLLPMIQLSAHAEDSTDSTDSTTVTAPAELPEHSPYPAQLENGDFEIPALTASYYPWHNKTMSEFESLAAEEDSEFRWKTTAVNESIEYVLRTNTNNKTNSSGKSINGREYYYFAAYEDVQYGYKNGELNAYGQFAELNSEYISSLYQNISTTAGEVLDWSFAHRARKQYGTTQNSEYDTMALIIGPAQNDEYLNKTASSQKIDGTTASETDIFQAMGKKIKTAYYKGEFPEKDSVSVHTIYSTPYAAYYYKLYGDDGGDDVVSLTKTEVEDFMSEKGITGEICEWQVWIITSTQKTWHNVSSADYGSYSVPDGQDETIFAFTALSGNTTNNTETGMLVTEGNLLDNITFRASYPIRVSSTSGGSGTVDSVSVTSGNSYTGQYYYGTDVNITATAAESDGQTYSFIGVMINNTFYSSSDAFSESGNTPTDDSDIKLTKNTDGTYTITVNMTKARSVELLFARASTVAYDPNGGLYNNSDVSTLIDMASDGIEGTSGRSIKLSKWTNDMDAVPKADKTDTWRFIGWTVGSIGGTTLIDSNHIVTYNSGDDSTDSTDDTLDLVYKIKGAEGDPTTEASVSASRGITFVAKWEYLQEAVVQTKKTKDAKYYGAADDSGNSKYTEAPTETVTPTDGDSYAGGTIKSIKVASLSGESRTEETSSTTIDQKCYAQLADAVTVTAKAADGYIFMGWYDENEKLLSYGSTYTYSVSGGKKIYARFSAVLAYPILAYVPATKGNTSSGTFNGNSTLMVGNDTVSGYGGRIGGEEVYGTTIATGFTAQRTQEQLSGNNYCEWTITINNPDTTYIKIPNTDNNGTTRGTENYDNINIEIDKTGSGSAAEENGAVFKDNDNVKVNGGSIYKVSKFGSTESTLTEALMTAFAGEVSEDDENETITDDAENAKLQNNTQNNAVNMNVDENTDENSESIGDVGSEATLSEDTTDTTDTKTWITVDDNSIQIRLYQKIPETDTSGSVVFGIVLDNIYAPSAVATIDLVADAPTDNSYFNVDSTSKYIAHSTKDNPYDKNSENKYLQAEN